MKIIYLRHGEKLYNNGKNPPGQPSHDPPLTSAGQAEIRASVAQLVADYGMPHTIVTSPYLRARQTVEEILSCWSPEVSQAVAIRCDRDISEYLGNQKSEKLDVMNETRSFNPPHPETFRQFQQRIHRYYEKISRYLFDNPQEEIVWVNTHGIVIQTIGRTLNLNLNHIQPFEGIMLEVAP